MSERDTRACLPELEIKRQLALSRLKPGETLVENVEVYHGFNPFEGFEYTVTTVKDYRVVIYERKN